MEYENIWLPTCSTWFISTNIVKKVKSAKIKVKSWTKIIAVREKLVTFATASPDGEMVDALVSGASAERRVGSSPILGTSKGVFCWKLLFRLSRIGLVQSVAVWQSCLWSAIIAIAIFCL